MSSRGWWCGGDRDRPRRRSVSPHPPAPPRPRFDDTCADVYGKRAVGDLDKTTDPAPGSPVTSGEQVSVTLTWPTFAVAGERAHRVMECLSIDGGAPRLWADRQFTSASGTVSLAADPAEPGWRPRARSAARVT